MFDVLRSRAYAGKSRAWARIGNDLMIYWTSLWEFDSNIIT